MAGAEVAVDQQVFVGIDSGGTRTNVHVVVPDDTAERTSSYELEDSLSGALATNFVDGVMHRIFAPLDARLRELDANDRDCFVWISAAGYSPWTRDHYVYALEDTLQGIAGINLRAVGVANDAVSLLLGSNADAIVIAGTGSSTLVKSSSGDFYQAGGRDWVASDYGSGFWIGLLAIRQAYKDFEAGEDSVLLQRVRDVYGIRSHDRAAFIAKMRDLSIGDDDMKKEIARVTVTVCAAAERGDVGAQNIVKTGAEDLADVTAGALRRSFSREELAAGIDMVRCGSVLGNAFYRSTFEAQVDRRLLSGSGQPAVIRWRDAATGRDAAVDLASRIATRADDLLRLSRDYRPAIVHVR